MVTGFYYYKGPKFYIKWYINSKRVKNKFSNLYHKTKNRTQRGKNYLCQLYREN